jgi:hypothetical protein
VSEIDRVRMFLDLPRELVPDETIRRYLEQYRGNVPMVVSAIRHALLGPARGDSEGTGRG